MLCYTRAPRLHVLHQRKKMSCFAQLAQHGSRFLQYGCKNSLSGLNLWLTVNGIIKIPWKNKILPFTCRSSLENLYICMVYWDWCYTMLTCRNECALISRTHVPWVMWLMTRRYCSGATSTHCYYSLEPSILETWDFILGCKCLNLRFHPGM